MCRRWAFSVAPHSLQREAGKRSLSPLQLGKLGICGLHKITQLLGGVSDRRLCSASFLPNVEQPKQELQTHALSLPQAARALEAE